MMKKLTLSFMSIVFAMAVFFPRSLFAETFYFPECQVQIPAPNGWYGYNETNVGVGVLFVSKEKINGPYGRFKTGLTLLTNLEKVLKIDIPNTEYLTVQVFPPLIQKYYHTSERNYYDIEGELGTFKFLEIKPKGRSKPAIAAGVLKTDKGAFQVLIESPLSRWKSIKPTLLEMVKNIRLTMSRGPGDVIVDSVKEHTLSRIYRQRDKAQKAALLLKFKKLEPGMSEEQYKKIVKYEWDIPEKTKTGMNFTPGWLQRRSLSADGDEYVDIYGVYDRCICEELFYVHIKDKKIEDVKAIDRRPPADFDVEEWQESLVGFLKGKKGLDRIYERIEEWTTEPARAIMAMDYLKNVRIGMSEQEYLTSSRGFMINFSILFTDYVVPGVARVNFSKDKEEVKREYVYAYKIPGKFYTGSKGPNGELKTEYVGDKYLMPMGKVVVLNGKVASVKVSGEKERGTKKSKPKIIGTGHNRYYISPDDSFKIKVPVGPGGDIREDEMQDEQSGRDVFVVSFWGIFGTVYAVQTFQLDKDESGVNICEQLNEIARSDSSYAAEESLTTKRGTETWMQKIVKGGSPNVRTTFEGTGSDRKMITRKLDFYVTSTCFRVGNRIFNVWIGRSEGIAGVTYSKRELFAKNKEALKKFLDGFEIKEVIR